MRSAAQAIQEALDCRRRRDLFRLGIESQDHLPEVPTFLLTGWQADRLADEGMTAGQLGVRVVLVDDFMELNPENP